MNEKQREELIDSLKVQIKDLQEDFECAVKNHYIGDIDDFYSKIDDVGTIAGNIYIKIVNNYHRKFRR